ncbi:hypothetical protein [Streptomyces omiyaensis]|uniref:hypothetical protein n=1 Tax=Streptomyces omiyaensis TaxID=68247 RepID=UPI0036FEE145
MTRSPHRRIASGQASRGTVSLWTGHVTSPAPWPARILVVRAVTRIGKAGEGKGRRLRSVVDGVDDGAVPGIPATSRAVLGPPSFGREPSGYDCEKRADRSPGLFHGSPSLSRIHAETPRRRAAADAAGADETWAHPLLTLTRAERYHAAERGPADAVLADIERAEGER